MASEKETVDSRCIVRSVASALAADPTLEAVTKSWADNRVPARYVERTIAESRDAFASAGQSRAAAIATTLDAVVRRNDRRALAGALRALHAERGVLESSLARVKPGR